MTSKQPLVDNPALYFDLTVEHKLISLSRLSPTKPPESQPASVKRAEELMRLAAAGAQPKRAPITVQYCEGGRFQIVDGNATYGVAVRHGFERLPASVQPS